jgi:hypothetical protein
VPRRRAGGDDGNGVLATSFGLTFLIVLLLVATQLAINLFVAASVGDELARSADRVASHAAQSGAAVQQAETTRLLTVVAKRDPNATVVWTSDPAAGWVEVRITMANQHELLPGVDRLIGMGTITRSARSRIEVTR